MRDWGYKWIWGPHWIEWEKSDRETYPVANAIYNVFLWCVSIAAIVIVLMRLFKPDTLDSYIADAQSYIADAWSGLGSYIANAWSGSYMEIAWPYIGLGAFGVFIGSIVVKDVKAGSYITLCFYGGLTLLATVIRVWG